MDLSPIEPPLPVSGPSRTRMPEEPPKKPAMRKHTGAHPGIELDGKGHPIPVEERLPDDKAATHRAAKARSPRKRKG